MAYMRLNRGLCLLTSKPQPRQAKHGDYRHLLTAICVRNMGTISNVSKFLSSIKTVRCQRFTSTKKTWTCFAKCSMSTGISSKKTWLINKNDLYQGNNRGQVLSFNMKKETVCIRNDRLLCTK